MSHLTDIGARGLFITLEGIEGAGKSTLLPFVAEQVEAGGRRARITREPGGTVAGEAIREILLHRDGMHIADETELLLVFAARAQHLAEVIRPALARGEVVICDRFTDSTYAYQGGGRGIATDRIRALEDRVQGGLRPDLTLLFDVPVGTGLERARRNGAPDRFEGENAAFFERVRSRYLELARDEPGRVRIIDTARTEAEVRDELRRLLQEALSR
jgi:dTMP kinase